MYEKHEHQFYYIGAKYFYNAYFGEGTGPILLYYVHCSVPTFSLLNCNINTYYYYKYYYFNNHYDDVGVRCQRKLKDIFKYTKYYVIDFSILSTW